MVNVVKQEQKNKAVKESRGAAALHKADLQVFEVESPLWLCQNWALSPTLGSSKEPSILHMLSQGQPSTTEKDKDKSCEAEIAYCPLPTLALETQNCKLSHMVPRTFLTNAFSHGKWLNQAFARGAGDG